MPTRSRRGAALSACAALVLGCVSCSTSPTSPSPAVPPVPPAPPATIVSLSLVAPPEIAPGESVQLIVNAVKSDGAAENVTSQAQWTVESAPTGSTVLALTATGLATGGDRGRAAVTARVGDLRADATMLVLPKGTFRLAGRVRDGSVGVADVVLTVIRGIGEGLSTRSDAAGDYELYGVAGSVQIRASKSDYLDRVELVDVTAHGSLIVELTSKPPPTPGPPSGAPPGLPPAPPGPPPAPPAPPPVPLVNYAGTYTMTVTGTRCTPTFPEAAKRRIYTARIDQTGADLQVTLTGADFLPGSSAFAGTVTPTGAIQFGIRPSSVWDYDGFDLQERLSDGTVLVTFGTITATGTPAGISGTATAQESGTGGILHLPPRGSSWSLADATGSCYIDRFDMVPKS